MEIEWILGYYLEVMYTSMQMAYAIVYVAYVYTRKTGELLKENIVANFRVHLSAGFTSSNKISVSPRSNHREWLTQCKNFYYYYEKKTKLNWLFVFYPKMEQESILTKN